MNKTMNKEEQGLQLNIAVPLNPVCQGARVVLWGWGARRRGGEVMRKGALLGPLRLGPDG
jgi:hypothetical protein